ncbi:hypothetical protein F0562_004968 [Nyssa sinensis]|uniref:Protein kinase domain-containing protein n=1 Tax=Nyssa sinensis TaxID=561372 RepID=A0A5J5AJ95_9ASTE|nr:hypothetical protein F0562_004968 [Nyssa sinensis]
MNQIPCWVLLISFFLLLHTTKSGREGEVKAALLNFLEKLSNSNSPPDPIWGWNQSSDPCKDHWKGITCDGRNLSVKKIILEGLNFSGILDASALCNVQSLAVSLSVLSLYDNNISGENLDQIGNCRQLARFNINRNRFSGSLPNSLSSLSNLKTLDISNNNFSGNLPDLTRISGLIDFLVQNNQITGLIPNFDFSNLMHFNVSYNYLSGPIPFEAHRFPVSSFIGNPELCGDPLPNKCPSLPSESQEPEPKKSKGISIGQILMFSGYFLIGVVLLLLISLKICNKDKKKEEKVAAVDDSVRKPSVMTSSEYKEGVMSKSEISAASADQSGLVSSSLIVLTSPEANGLRFEDLLKAPAELLGKGKNSSVYKVICEELGMTVAVKRIRDWAISNNDFKERMLRLDQVRHTNILPPLAFYCSKQEKLLVYEYHQNGSLFRLLHGTQMGQAFGWSIRLGIAASIADALAFMHHELRDDGLAHGNLKLSNILLNKNMEPCISEYGLMVADNLDQPSLAIVNSQQMTEQTGSSFKSDIYGLGVVLLELLTGKLVQNSGLDLARWVLSVVREEWTVEVFDRTLIREGASEERMVNLLQVAVKCVNRSPEARPSINQVALMINTIHEDEERFIVSEA